MKPREYISLFARRNPWAKRVLLRLIPNMPRIVQVPGIGPMRILTRDHRSYWLRHPLEQDDLFLGGIANLLEPGMTVWDVGAHIGLYARMFSQVMQAGHVVAFEPDPRNRDLLAQNLEIGDVSERTTVLPYALCDMDGVVDFVGDTQSTQQGHIVGTRRDENNPSSTLLRVQTRTIDSLIASGECSPPNLIKIDVEGAEAALLRGAHDTLRQHSPLLAIELHTIEVRLPVFDELHAANYVIHGYRARKWRRLSRIDFEQQETLYDPRHIYAARDEQLLHKPALCIAL